MLVVTTSCSAAPGATSVAVGLALTWPGPRSAMVLEADPAGGVLALRFGLCRSPGVAELASDTRSGISAQPVAGAARALSQELPVGARALLAASADQMLVALPLLIGGGVIEALAADQDLVVIADAGRCTRDSPALGLLEAAGVVLVVAGGWADCLEPVATQATKWRSPGPVRERTHLVLTGPQPYPVAEVEAATGLPVVAVLPDDPRSAAVLTGRAAVTRSWRRSTLIRALRDLAATLEAGPSRPGDAHIALGQARP